MKRSELIKALQDIGGTEDYEVFIHEWEFCNSNPIDKIEPMAVVVDKGFVKDLDISKAKKGIPNCIIIFS